MSALVFTDQQIQWFKENFANTPNADLAKELGCSRTKLYKLAKLYGLTKSVEHIKRMQLVSCKASHEKRKITGYKGFPNPHRWRKGENWRDNATEEKIQKWKESVAESRNRSYQKARMRVLYSLPPVNNVRVSFANRKRRAQALYLRKQGYIIDEQLRVAYWDENTIRAVRLEAKEDKFYKFEPLTKKQAI